MALSAYFDEAGHPDDPNAHSFVIAGCIAEEEAWQRWEQEWSSILDEERIHDSKGVRWCHWKALRHGQDAFKGWDADRIESFIVRLRTVIQNHVSLVIAAYDEFEAKERQKLRPHYMRAHEYIIRMTVATLSSGGRQLNEPVHFVFAKHPEINPIAHHDMLRASLVAAQWPADIAAFYGSMYEKIGDLAPSDPRTTMPLQAADLIAGELYQWIPTAAGGRLPKTLQPLTVPFVLRRIQW